MPCDVKWFEMRDLKKRSLTRASWIPLCAYDDSRKKGRYGLLGYENEYFGAGAILFPAHESKRALELEWMDVSRNWGHRPFVEDNEYFPAGTFRTFRGELTGTYPVLQQSFETGEPTIWHLIQDIVLGLDLYREGDVWVRPQEDYTEVARIRRSNDGELLRLEIRAEQLRDFLCAKGYGILVATYQSREIIVDFNPEFKWENGSSTETGEHYQWEGRIQPIHEGGMPYGAKTAVFHVGRTNIDPGEDTPTYGMPGEDEYETKSWEKTEKGRKLFRIQGEMWRNEWIPPSNTSPRVRGDPVEPAQISFVVDTSGTMLSGENLEHHRGWLWFKPSVIQSLLEKRKGFLNWYTEETGQVGPAPHRGVHFGVNDLGLINVLAKDMALLPEICQKVWVTHNVPPDGGVSKELLKSQMEAKPANTKAPEALVLRAIDHLQKVSTHFLGRPLLKEHPAAEKISEKIHRFHGHSMEGIYFLCKELTRLIIERIDEDLLKMVDPTADKKLRSIKRLEHFLTSKGFNGQKITAPLVGAYELRLGDAHLPSEEITESLSLLGITDIKNYQQMAKQAISCVAFSVGITGDLIIKIYKDE